MSDASLQPWALPAGAKEGGSSGSRSLPTGAAPAESATPHVWLGAQEPVAETHDAGPGAGGDTEQLVLRVSQLLEDKPELAPAFAECIKLSTSTGERLAALQALCDAQQTSEVCPPSRAQLRQVCLASALPFLGFGILDNAVMIAFGDIIDSTLCVTCGFSTMAAAALGNTFSDGIGVFSGGLVEDLARKGGVEAPPLSRAQETMEVTKRWERLGQLVGIITGCLIGMFPLLLLDSHKAELLKRERTLDDMYEHVVTGAADMLSAEAAMIMFVDGDTRELYTRSTASVGGFRSPIGEGIMGRVAESGRFLNIHDVRAPESREYYSAARHDNYHGTGIVVRSVLCMPIFSYDEQSHRADKIVGVLEVINKKDGSNFAEKDEDILAALCSHISTSLSFVHGEEHGFDYTLQMCERTLNAKGSRINAAQNRRVHALYNNVMHEVVILLRAESAQLLTVDARSQELHVLASSSQDADPDELPVLCAVGDPCAAGRAAASGRAVVLDAEGGGRKELCCPIFDIHEEVIGVLQVVGKSDGDDFSKDDVRILGCVARDLALSLEGTGSSLCRVLQKLAVHGEE